MCARETQIDDVAHQVVLLACLVLVTSLRNPKWNDQKVTKRGYMRRTVPSTVLAFKRCHNFYCPRVHHIADYGIKCIFNLGIRSSNFDFNICMRDCHMGHRAYTMPSRANFILDMLKVHRWFPHRILACTFWTLLYMNKLWFMELLIIGVSYSDPWPSCSKRVQFKQQSVEFASGKRSHRGLHIHKAHGLRVFYTTCCYRSLCVFQA
jgi:hypothetical protein